MRLTQLRTGRRPGVIVLDLRMPVMDGWAFRVAQRADPRSPRIPVVILSGADARRFQEIEAVAALESRSACRSRADRLHRIVKHPLSRLYAGVTRLRYRTRVKFPSSHHRRGEEPWLTSSRPAGRRDWPGQSRYTLR